MRPTICSLVAALLLAAAPAARAEQRDSKPSKAATIVKWTLIGTAAGGGVGFLLGFKAYDDATFAERKIGQATAAGAGIGAGVGFSIGMLRSKPVPAAPSAAPSLWTPTSRMRRPLRDDPRAMATTPQLPTFQLRKKP